MSKNFFANWRIEIHPESNQILTIVSKIQNISIIILRNTTNKSGEYRSRTDDLLRARQAL